MNKNNTIELLNAAGLVADTDPYTPTPAPGIKNLSLLGLITPGTFFYVDSVNGSDSYDGLAWATPKATIDAAISLCTAAAGDTIVVAPHHAETVTTAITMDVTNVSIVGLHRGRLMPTVTGNAAIDAITITAAGCSVSGIKFAAPGTDAQTSDINIAAANCTVKDTVHIGSATSVNKVAIITITAAGHDALVDGVKIYNSVVEVVGAIAVEGTAARVEICNCMVLDVIGFTNGALHVAAVAVQIYVHDNIFQNAKAATAVVNFAANATGVCTRNFVSGRHTTIASNIVTGTSTDWFENYVTEEAVKNGLLMPAVDAD